MCTPNAPTPAPTSATPTKYPKNMMSAPTAPPPSAPKISNVVSLEPRIAVPTSAPRMKPYSVKTSTEQPIAGGPRNHAADNEKNNRG